ncbi:MAG: DUF861 domain-containing protein [Gammaproteobacteria bacterium]|nr:DUF861 domain-containing protein [Gammaproteobacteria bacterium]
MTDQTVILFDANGDPESGLQTWDPIPAESLACGEPVQRGHIYFSTASDRLTAGVWDCTPYEEVRGPYSVDEFMVLLEGSLDIENEDGSTQTFRAGDGCVIPKGAVLRWKQSEYLRKFWVIHDDADSPPAAAGLTALLANPDAELPRMPRADAALFESDVPDMGMHVLYHDPGNRFIAGVWESTPMTRVASTIERSELMHIIAGSGSITNADGVVFNFRTGDTFLVPVGMGYRWSSDEYVKKLFCSYTP